MAKIMGFFYFWWCGVFLCDICLLLEGIDYYRQLCVFFWHGFLQTDSLHVRNCIHHYAFQLDQSIRKSDQGLWSGQIKQFQSFSSTIGSYDVFISAAYSLIIFFYLQWCLLSLYGSLNHCWTHSCQYDSLLLYHCHTKTRGNGAYQYLDCCALSGTLHRHL